MSSFYPTNIGFLPTGANGRVEVSSVILGRNTSGVYEGIGFGAGGRPDYLETVIINLSKSAGAVQQQFGTITLNVNDVVAAKVANSHVPLNLNLTLKQVLVCESGNTKAMMIIGSQTYATGAS